MRGGAAWREAHECDITFATRTKAPTYVFLKASLTHHLQTTAPAEPTSLPLARAQLLLEEAADRHKSFVKSLVDGDGFVEQSGNGCLSTLQLG